MEKHKIMTFDPQKNKEVLAGYFNNGIFHKFCKETHYMRNEKGYGVQRDVLIQLTSLNCRLIRLHLPKKKGVIDIPFQMYLASRARDYGHGLQHFVNLDNIKGDLFSCVTMR